MGELIIIIIINIHFLVNSINSSLISIYNVIYLK